MDRRDVNFGHFDNFIGLIINVSYCKIKWETLICKFQNKNYSDEWQGKQGKHVKR